jgi:hypothetical protein
LAELTVPTFGYEAIQIHRIMAAILSTSAPFTGKKNAGDEAGQVTRSGIPESLDPFTTPALIFFSRTLPKG